MWSPEVAIPSLLRLCLIWATSASLSLDFFLSHSSPHSSVELQCKASHAEMFSQLRLGGMPRQSGKQISHLCSLNSPISHPVLQEPASINVLLMGRSMLPTAFLLAPLALYLARGAYLVNFDPRAEAPNVAQIAPF